MQSRNKDTDLEKKRTDTKAGSEGEMNWEAGTDIYTLLYIKQVTNERASQVAPAVKILPDNAENASNTGSIPVLGRSPGVGNSNPPLKFCLEKSHGQRSLGN